MGWGLSDGDVCATAVKVPTGVLDGQRRTQNVMLDATAAPTANAASLGGHSAMERRCMVAIIMGYILTYLHSPT
jgi:hypothetical protein